MAQCAAGLVASSYRLGGVVQSNAHRHGARIDAWVERAVPERVDLLIINKSGREEARGRGLRQAIAEVVIANIPLVISVSTENLCDFLTFVGDSAARLRSDIEAITAWCRNAIERDAHRRFRPSSLQA